MRHIALIVFFLAAASSAIAQNVRLTCAGAADGDSLASCTTLVPLANPGVVLWCNTAPMTTGGTRAQCAGGRWITSTQMQSWSPVFSSGGWQLWGDTVFASAQPPPPTPTVSNAVITWTAPTLNADATPVCAITGYRVERSTADAGPWSTVATVTQLTYTDTPAAVGTYWYTVRTLCATLVSAQSRPVSIVVNSIACPARPADETRVANCAAPLVGSWTQTRTYSSVAAPACWAAGEWLPQEAPAGACVPPPQVLRTAETTVYRLAQSTNRITYTAIGTIALGVACDAAQPTAGGYHIVNRSLVVLNAGVTTRPSVTLARCSLQ
jgi:hypothetical protein